MNVAAVKLELDLGYLEQLATLFRRQQELDNLSPAARAMEQRSIVSEFNLLEAQIRSAAARDPRRLLERAQVRIEEQLAAAGDRAEPELVQLQHDLADFLTR